MENNAKPELVFGDINNLKGEVIIYAQVINNSPSKKLIYQVLNLKNFSELKWVYNELNSISNVYRREIEELLLIKNKALTVIVGRHNSDLGLLEKKLGFEQEIDLNPESIWIIPTITSLSHVYYLAEVLGYDLLFSGFYSFEENKKNMFKNLDMAHYHDQKNYDLKSKTSIKELEALIMTFVDAHESLWDAGRYYYEQYEWQSSGVLLNHLSNRVSRFEDASPHYFLRYGRFWEEFLKPLMYLLTKLRKLHTLNHSLNNSEYKDKTGYSDYQLISNYYAYVISLYNFLCEPLCKEADIIIKALKKACSSTGVIRRYSIELANLVVDKLRATKLGDKQSIEKTSRVINERFQELFPKS